MSDDPRWLGPSPAQVEDHIRELADEAEHIQTFLRLVTSPDWRQFIEYVKERDKEVDRELARAGSWEKTCRLQGRKQAYDWLLSFEDQQRVALDSVIEELKGYQERLEERT